jgi:hypothetical protein
VRHRAALWHLCRHRGPRFTGPLADRSYHPRWRSRGHLPAAVSFRVSVGTYIRRRLEPGLPPRLPVQLLAAMPARLRLFRIGSSMWFHGSAPYTATGTVQSLMREAAPVGGHLVTVCHESRAAAVRLPGEHRRDPRQTRDRSDRSGVE